MVGEPIDEGDGARGVGKDGVPFLKREIGGDHDRALFVAPADDLVEQVGGVGVVGEVADLVDGEEQRARVGAESAFERAGGVLAVEIEEEVRRRDEERGVPGEDGLMDEVLG